MVNKCRYLKVELSSVRTDFKGSFLPLRNKTTIFKSFQNMKNQCKIIVSRELPDLQSQTYKNCCGKRSVYIDM